jgi:GT2 family glycosyltransferase
MIAAVVTSYGRWELLRRLLASLRRCTPPLRVVVVDNHPEHRVRSLVRTEGWGDMVVLEPPENLGPGGGVALGLTHALTDPAVQHVLICDDDAEVDPTAPAALAEIADRHGSAAALPLIERADGTIGWFPGLLEPAKWRVIKRSGLRPAEYLTQCGPDPVRFSWAPWPVLLITRAAIVACGVPRADVWYQISDLEYTLRLSAQRPCLWVPTVRCRHLPPGLPPGSRRGYFYDCCGLQNSFYVFVHLPHARSALRHLPGNLCRFVARWGARPSVFADLFRAFWWGTLRARPGGATGFTYFRERAEQCR